MPLHPLFVHLPIALAFILPLLVFIFAYMIKTDKMTPQTWLIIIGMQIALTISGYVAIESGENEENKVQRVVSREIIQTHENASKLFVGSTVIALVISIGAFFIRKEFQFQLKLAVGVVALMSAFLAYRAGILGGELVYIHGAASAYETDDLLSSEGEGLLPTPGMNTSESSMPVNENESLKRDENEYDAEDYSFEEDLYRQED